MPKKRCIILLVFVLCCASGFAQKYQYLYYTGSNMPFKGVNQVIHDHLGYTWVATNEGLFRFDGTTFEDYNTGLRSKSIRAFEKWDENTILFTNDTGIHQITYKGKLPVINVFKEGLRLQYPTNLFKDSKGDLWVGQLDGKIHKVSKNVFKPFELSTDHKTEEMFFGEDKYGAIWVLLPGNGIFYLLSEHGKFKRLSNFKDASHFLVDKDILWIAGEAIHQLKIQPDHGLENVLTINTEKPFLRVVQRDEDNLMLAKESELFLFRHKEGEAGLKKMFGSNDPHRVEELPYDQIRQLVFDKTTSEESIIWVSTSSGLGLMWSGFFQTVFGLGYDNVSGLHTTSDGRTLVSQGPVFDIGDETGEMRFRAANSLSNLTGISSKGELRWFGSTSGQIYHYRQDQLQKTYDLSDRGGGIFFMITDHQGEIWFCQATSNKPLLGTAKLDKNGKLVEYGADKGFTSRILVVREGGKNELYAAGIGSSSYLYKYDRSEDRFVNKSLPFQFRVSATFEVHDMAVDDLGIVWMATTDGLLKYDAETTRRVDLGPYTKGEIRAIVAAHDGSLWMSTDTNGLIYLDKEGHYTLFNENSGTPSKVASYRCMTFDSKQRLWVGTAEGLVYTPKSKPRPLKTSVPLIKSLKSSGRDVIADLPIRFKELSALGMELGTVTFPSEDIKYQYRVYAKETPTDEITDLSWIDLESSSLEINNLEGGHYFLEIRAQKEGGFQWSDGQTYSLEAVKRWYRSWWGILLLGLAGCLFFWYALRQWSLKRIKRLHKNLRQQQRELSAKRAELRSSDDTIAVIYQIVNEVHEQIDLNTLIDLLRPLVTKVSDIDGFEIAQKLGNEVHYNGYAKNRRKATNRSEEFNEKENLASYVMCSGKPLRVENFDKEASQYISGRHHGGYLSKIIIPFRSQVTAAALCIYSKKENSFSAQEFMLFKMLMTLLETNTKVEAK